MRYRNARLLCFLYFSYRKQIAHQLRTKYVENIYHNTVTLKSRSLKVIENGDV